LNRPSVRPTGPAGDDQRHAPFATGLVRWRSRASVRSRLRRAERAGRGRPASRRVRSMDVLRDGSGPTHVGWTSAPRDPAVLMDERAPWCPRSPGLALLLRPRSGTGPGRLVEGVITTLRSLGPAVHGKVVGGVLHIGTLCILDERGRCRAGHALLGHAGCRSHRCRLQLGRGKLAWLAAEAPALLEQGRVFTTPGLPDGRLLGHTAPIDETQA